MLRDNMLKERNRNKDMVLQQCINYIKNTISSSPYMNEYRFSSISFIEKGLTMGVVGPKLPDELLEGIVSHFSNGGFTCTIDNHYSQRITIKF